MGHSFVVGSVPGYSAAAIPGASYPVLYLGQSQPGPPPSLLSHDYPPDNHLRQDQAAYVVCL